jgi:hypothetical protein
MAGHVEAPLNHFRHSLGRPQFCAVAIGNGSLKQDPDQAPGGQCLRLVGIDEDLSFYEGVGAGPDVAKVKSKFVSQ